MRPNPTRYELHVRGTRIEVVRMPGSKRIARLHFELFFCRHGLHNARRRKTIFRSCARGYRSGQLSHTVLNVGDDALAERIESGV